MATCAVCGRSKSHGIGETAVSSDVNSRKVNTTHGAEKRLRCNLVRKNHANVASGWALVMARVAICDPPDPQCRASVRPICLACTSSCVRPFAHSLDGTAEQPAQKACLRPNYTGLSARREGRLQGARCRGMVHTRPLITLARVRLTLRCDRFGKPGSTYTANR